MNSTYNLEPPPTAEVRFHTTAGTIDFELFGKQTPLATRNFLQHCLNGYYDKTIFHRVIPGFILQGGDPTGSGEGGEAIYDEGVFEDEFHSRLRFNRRGLLGMANTGPNDNGSQFFITLDKTEELTGKNTMFGRVVGDSIYVVAKLAEAELIEGSDRPLYPASVTKTEILLNPFPEMVVQRSKKPEVTKTKEPVKKKAKKKGTKTLLSFQDGQEDEADAPLLKKAKFNPKLVRAEENTQDQDSSEQIRSAEKRAQKPTRRKSSASPPPRRLSMKQHTNPQAQLPLRDEEVPSAAASSSSSPEPENVKRVSSALERTNAQIAELKASMKRNVHVPAAESHQKKSALEQMIPDNVIRGRKRKQGGTNQGDKQALRMLDAFKAKLEAADTDSSKNSVTKTATHAEPTVAIQDEQEDDEEAKLCDLHFIANCQSCQSWDKETAEEDGDINDRAWLTHALSFDKDRLGKDLNWKKRNEDDLVVIDPREKAKDIKDEQRAKKLARKGGSTAWDKDRDQGRVPERMAGSKG